MKILDGKVQGRAHYPSISFENYETPMIIVAIRSLNLLNTDGWIVVVVGRQVGVL
jgi:hypothetical protein